MRYNRDHRSPEFARGKPFFRILKEYFEMIENGTKTLEIRKEDEVANINPGQNIVFARGDNRNIEVRVTAKISYKNKQEALDELDKKGQLHKALPGTSKQDAEAKMKDVYPNYNGRITVLEIIKIQQELT